MTESAGELTAESKVPWLVGARGWAVIAIALGTMSAGLGWIAASGTDLPRLDVFAREAREFYLPTLRGETLKASGLNHWPGARAWALGWLKMSQHWDGRALSVANLGVLVLGLGALCGLFGRGLGRAWQVGLAITLGVLIGLAPVLPQPSATAAGVSGTLLLSLLHMGMMAGARNRPWWMVAGFGMGLLNVIAATAGVASAAALVLWFGVGAIRAPRPWAERRLALAANVGLVALGIALAFARSANADASASSFPAAFDWLLERPVWTLAIWAPAIFSFVKRPGWGLPALLALWAFLQIAALHGGRISDAEAILPILVIAVVANAACFEFFFSSPRRNPGWNQAMLWLWAIVVANGILHPPGETRRDFAGPPADSSFTLELRRAALTGDSADLKSSGFVEEAERGELVRLISDPVLHRVLPGSIRPPLAAITAGASGFQSGGVPEIAGRDELPALGTWMPSHAGAGVGDWVSAPIESRAAFVQIRIAGELNPPATSLVLRAADGGEVAPLENAFTADQRWKRINFAVPAGPFRIVAHDASPTAWLAFTAPQEIGRVTWLAGKIVRVWPWLLAGGLVAGGLSVWQSSRVRAVNRPEERLRIVWPLVPWMALVAYAVFFSNHIDGTAGPNDSGGYLNSAKTLVEGHVTATPRMVFGASAGETDITPYLPTTFHPTADGRMAPEYPVGFPLEIWAVAKLTSLSWAVPIVTIVQLALGVFFTRQLARAMGLGGGWDWLAGGIVGLSPVYLFQSLQPQSDGPAMVWVTAAIYWAWNSREKPLQAWLAGGATALAVMIRPSNLLCVAPILVCLSNRPRQVAWWVIGGIPAAIWQLWYNHRLYGHAFATGYGDVTSSFGWHFAPLTWKSYAAWLPVMFSPVVVLAPFGAFLRTVPGRVRMVLATWAAAFLLFYTFYWCTYDNWYNMRFVMPAAPAMLVLGLFVVRALTERAGLVLFSAGSGWKSAFPTVVFVTVLLGVVASDSWRRDIVYWMHANRNYAVAGEWARKHFPANAVVVAKPLSNSIYYYTDFTVVRSDHEKVRTTDFLDRVARAGRPIFAVTSHYEEKDFKWGAGRGSGYPDLPGRWERLAVLCDGEILAWVRRPE